MEYVVKHILTKIRNAEVRPDPFPHFIVPEIFPPEFYPQLMVSVWPIHLEGQRELVEHSHMSKKGRSAAEIRQVVEDFQHSGVTRREFCQRRQLPMTTLDYWRRAQSRQPRLLEVEVSASQPAPNFTLSLANGRRIESSWRFADAELVRLIRIAESA